jgi:pimeloyl-ACP methyl ester carboxylesterase
MKKGLLRALLAFVVILAPAVVAAGADTVPPIPPPPKQELKSDQRAEIERGVAALKSAIDALRHDLADKPALLARLPDVEIYYNALRYPLQYHEQIDFKPAQQAIRDGLARAEALASGKTPWVTTSGSRGYVSRIDHSVQPYVLLIPASYKPGESRHYPLEFVEHGRNEGLTELRMIQTTKDHAVGGAMEKFAVLLYGRYCNANKFAGEIDLLEAFDDVKRQYPIDEDRVLNIGFSMGGAACWQFATHYSDLFAAASPGAGFAETREFLHLSPQQIEQTPWYEKKLWHLYDCTDVAVNLFNLPTVAYSGELDAQKQSADIMEKYMAAEGLKLERIIGPKTRHAYEKGAKAELDKRLDELLAKGRDWNAPHVRFATYTLRYNRMKWVTVDAMGKEWERADVDAEIKGDHLDVTTKNVTALTLAPRFKGTVSIDGSKQGPIEGGTHQYIKTASGWKAGSLDDHELCKRHGLQGPVDDAFMDSFIIVKPTGKAANEKVGAWADAECAHAIDHWRKQFRGEARVKNDSDVTAADIADSNLVLFGDPSSNQLIAKIAGKLPVQWNAKAIALSSQTFPSDHHALVAIYPNPLNPKHYVVLNSGFTFREYDYLNNARQIPKLPDYAVIDVDTPVTPRGPGKVVDAGFFGEHWELLADEGR